MPRIARRLFFSPREFLGPGVALFAAVAFLSGVFSFGSVLRATLTNFIEEGLGRADLYVLPYSGPQSGLFEIDNSGSFDPFDVIRASFLPGVKQAVGVILGRTVVIFNGTEQRVRLVAGSFSPSLRSFALSAGRVPTAPDQVVISSTLAKDLGVHLGQRVALQAFNGSEIPVEVVGFAEQGAAIGPAGEAGVWLSPSLARELLPFARPSFVEVVKEPSASLDAVKSELAAAFPGAYVKTRAELLSSVHTAVVVASAVLEAALVPFSVVAFAVAGLVVANAARILLARRVQLVGLLRCLGATRREVGRRVVANAALVSLPFVVAGAITGLPGAYLAFSSIAHLKVASFASAFSITGLVVSCLVGMAAAVLASAVPAAYASAVPPVAAVRFAGERVKETSKLRTASGIAVLALAAVLQFSSTALSGNTHLVFGVLAKLAVFVAFMLLMPVIFALFRRPVEVTTGRLKVRLKIPARNVFRNPARSAAVSAALIVSLSLVTFISVIGSSFSATLTRAVRAVTPYDFVLASNDPARGIPDSVVKKVASLPGVMAGAEVGPTAVNVLGPAGLGNALAEGISPGFVSQGALKPGASGPRFREGEVLLSSSLARETGAAVGGEVTVEVEGSYAASVSLKVAGILSQGGAVGGLVTTDVDLKKVDPFALTTAVLIRVAGGYSKTAVTEEVAKAAAPYKYLAVEDVAGVAAEIQSVTNRIVDIITGLLGFSLLIGLLGVVTSAGLSIYERRRELGVLRALGLSSADVASMVVLEALLLGFIGLLLGTAWGVLGAWSVSLAVSVDHQHLVLSVPFGRLLPVVLGSLAVLMVASLLPAREGVLASVDAALRRE